MVKITKYQQPMIFHVINQQKNAFKHENTDTKI